MSAALVTAASMMATAYVERTAPRSEQGPGHETPLSMGHRGRLADSHCHLLASLEGELQACLLSYLKSPVAHFNLYSTTLANAQRVAAALRAMPPEAQARFSLGLGLHPWFLQPATFEPYAVGTVLGRGGLRSQAL